MQTHSPNLDAPTRPDADRRLDRAWMGPAPFLDPFARRRRQPEVAA